MLSEQFHLLFPAVAALLLLAVLVLYVFYTTARHFRLKLLLGPALLAACAVAVPAVGTRLGYGWPAELPESFQYIAHSTVVADGKKRWIDVMVISRRSGAQARLHRVPWSSKMQEVLEHAERLKEGREGGDVVVSRPANTGNAAARDADPGYSAQRVLPRDTAPKRPAVPQRPQQAPQDQAPTSPVPRMVV
ncbi:MAG TPA: hypothetical protein VHL79_02255 [Ramlibacter sp.]|jgi:hypothetical protein|nr:hypothetical protein [Ramlibacter sp.]